MTTSEIVLYGLAALILTYFLRRIHQAHEERDSAQRGEKTAKGELAASEKEMARLKAKIEEEMAQLETEIASRESEIARRESEAKKLLAEATTGNPWLAGAIADLEKLRHDESAWRLRTKKHPALKASEQLTAIGRELRVIRAAQKEAQYVRAYYEGMVPWLPEILGQDFQGLQEELIAASSNDDPASSYLSASDYAKLSPVERNQLALDRYNITRKTPWQIGRHYERFIGHTYEGDGWRVTYYGAEQHLRDLGRDLIATKDGKTHIVQCKCWAAEKTIHEKHVYQLFGTSLDYALENAGGLTKAFNLSAIMQSVEPVLVVSCRLSEKAKQAAKVLNVSFREDVRHPRSWPQIKCNISITGEKIYHLPFDQQYDRTAIGDNPGEFFASNVAEAEAAGFRRAFRWKRETD